jgi:hypothetical protein
MYIYFIYICTNKAILHGEGWSGERVSEPATETEHRETERSIGRQSDRERQSEPHSHSHTHTHTERERES